jgi:DNA-binding NtrC family response regulator
LKTATVDDRIRILHVDDDSTSIEVSKQILMNMGNFDVDNACCVDEAFKKLAIGHYDVVVSDYEMPQKDGLQFLKELREQKNEIPFIFFTGKGREVAIKALNLGADGYVNKRGAPETIYGELSHAIRQVVEHNKTKKELQGRDIRLAKLACQIPGVLYQLMRRADGTYCVPYASVAFLVVHPKMSWRIFSNRQSDRPGRYGKGLSFHRGFCCPHDALAM